MSRKLLSVLLAVLMVISSVSCLFTANTVTATAEEENLMASIKPSDWTSGWNGSTGVNAEMNGIAVKAAYRSAYTKVTLSPEAKHTFSFSFGQVRVGDVRVYPASEITDPATQLMSVGSLPAVGGTTNLATGTFETELAKGAPADGAFYKASETFKTTTDTEYYIILDCYDFVTTSVVLRNISLVEHPYDPNVLADSVAADWTSSWGPKDATTNADGNITVGVAYRSAYTKVTLDPNTKYDFSFSHGEVRVTDIRVFAASEITDPSTQLVSGTNGGAVTGGTNNLAPAAVTTDCPATPVAGEFYTASETFKTGSETEYYIILDCGAFSTTSIVLKDLSLLPVEYVLANELVDPANWSSTWRLQGSTVNITAATESKDGGAGIYVDKSNYRDSFVTLTLDPNSEYTLSFNYKGISELNRVEVYAKDDIDLTGYYATNSKYPDNLSAAKKSGVTAIADYYTKNIGTFDGATWFNVTVTFNTNSNTEYYIVLGHGDKSGFTASDLTLEKKFVDPDNVLGNSVAANWGTSWKDKTVTTNTAGYISITAAYRSAYTKVTLEPNTKYNFNFSHGEVKVTDIRVFAASEITDTTTQLVSADGGGNAPGGINNLATAAVTTDCPATPVAGEFYTSSESFTTGSETEYYIILDCGAFNTTSIVLKDLSLKKHVPNANVDITDTANWNSTWILQGGTVKITTTTDSCNGGAAVNVDRSNYRTTFVKLTLTPNANYNLTFNYKGTSAISRLHLIALNDIDETKYAAKPDHIINALKDGASSVFTQNYDGLTYDGTTWNEVLAEFATNANTEYYLVFENNTAGSGFTASDFNFAIASSDDSEGEVNENILANITKDDFVSTWDGSKGYTLTTMAVKAAWHTAYTKVTLAPNTNYDFSFGASNAKVNNVRVYAASEITDVSTQLTNANEWVAGGTNNLVTYFNSTAPADSYETATEDFISQVYTVSASFTTNTTDTEYYILIDGGQFLGNGAPYATFIFFKNFNLISKGEVYIDPNVLNDTAMTKLTWKALWKNNEGNNADQTITSTVLDKAQSYSGNSYVMQWGRQTRYRDNYTVLNLEPNTKYQLSFRYKAAGVEEYIHYVGFVASNKVDLALSAENIEGRLLDSNTEMLGKVNATVEKNLNGTWNLVSTIFTTGEETEYVFYMGIGNYVDNSFSTITLSDFDLREYEDPNKLVDATVANGQVRFSVGADSNAYYITGAEGKEDELVTYTNGEGTEVTRSRVYFYDSIEPQFNYNGGYSWRIILSSEAAMNVYNPAVYGYITAKGLAANTKYTFSYIYTDTYHIKLADVYNAEGSVLFDTTTKMLPTKDGATSHSYMVTATFTTGAEGDYNFKLQTGRSKKYYIYDASSWALTLSDLSLVVYEEGDDSVEIPDDANLLENPDELDWKATWSTISHSTNGYNGTKAISLGGIQYHALYTRLDTLAPNTEYALTFKYKSHAAIDVVGVTDAANVNPANVNDKFSSAVVKNGSITYYQNVEKVIDNATWNNATVKFVTGDSTTYYLYIEGNSAANSAVAGGFVISDMSLTKVLDKSNAIVVDYDFENGTIGAVSTTSSTDVPSIAEENGNQYLKFTRTNDGVTIPFYYRANQKYVVSFDMKVLSYPTEQLQFRFRTSEGDNNPITYEGNVFAYNNNAYSLVTKDMNGKLLSGPAGLNNNADYQFNGYKQNIENHTDWVHYEITIDPDYTYYTGLANFGFDAGEAGWSIALDNIKVAALDNTFEQDAEAKFEPAKYAAIRQRTIDTKQGIRVKSSIDTSLLAGDIKVVEYGTLAINKNKLGDAELVYDMVNSDAYGAKLGVAYSVDDNKNDIFEQSGNIVTFTGTLVGLANYTTDYAVRGYMIAESADGERFVIYEEDTKTVSVYDVVYAILNDGVTNDDDTTANQIVSANETKYNNWVDENYAEENLTGSQTVNLTVSNSASPVINNYRGFSGTVYHAFGFMEDDASGRVYDEEMRNTELDRLEDAGVHYVRTRYQSQWIFDDATGYDWNSDRFGYFLNYAKALQERDIEVILQVGWHFDFISQEGTYSIRENDYFNGEGDDLYGESAGFDFTGKSDDDTRVIKAAHRYAYMMANTLKLAKAAGVNNIKYFSYFVEPSNAYSEDGWDSMVSGHDKEQYVLFCRTMRDALEDNYNVNDVKHVGPNEAGYSRLIEYVLDKDPDLFDILTAHNYPQEGDVQTNYDDYYETMTDNPNSNILNGAMTDFSAYADFLEEAKANSGNNDIEFWSDEFNIKDFSTTEDARGSSSFYRGLATAMGGIVAQQKGIQNTVLWMSFDQLWTDGTHGDAGTVSEFMNGIHQCGNAPSLFLSDQPYAQYYPTTLFSKYNGYKNGTVYATNLDDTQSKGVYVGAVKLEDGSWTVSVVNMNSTPVNVNVVFGTAINQTLYRHVVSADKADTYADAKIPDADKTFANVGTTFSDVLPAGSFAVYTGVR